MSYVAARDGRKNRSAPVRAPSVPDRLDDLHGHSVGPLEVPHHMAAGHASRRRYDLDDPVQCRHAYKQVLCEAANCGEVEDLLNPALLRRVWRDLHLPSRVREAWETRHPSLRRTRVAMTAPASANRTDGARADTRAFARRSRVQIARAVAA
ncbi:hypothetical protein [Actinoplanes aureus]|uniref:Uncharacterized protein n=1 Tax=Actinoplanes aureus TaxID=2792083 RepID=A0A931C174_9ACTN|nr:hypothetical protein [Actinoplanes aureus]MBG0561399.1 hypothetical protein [Actinoplanes aureus]